MNRLSLDDGLFDLANRLSRSWCVLDACPLDWLGRLNFRCDWGRGDWGWGHWRWGGCNGGWGNGGWGNGGWGNWCGCNGGWCYRGGCNGLYRRRSGCWRCDGGRWRNWSWCWDWWRTKPLTFGWERGCFELCGAKVWNGGLH